MSGFPDRKSSVSPCILIMSPLFTVAMVTVVACESAWAPVAVTSASTPAAQIVVFKRILLSPGVFRITQQS